MIRNASLGFATAMSLAVAPPLFAQDTQAKSDLLFILDASGSMWGQIDGVAKIETARAALKGLAADVAGDVNLGLLAYGHRREGDCSDTEVLLPTGAHDTETIGNIVDGILPRGKTPIAGALQSAPAAFSDADRQSDILLVSDGLETCGGDPCAAAAALAGQGINMRVHVIGFGVTAGEANILSCIAENGGGLSLIADTAGDLTNALQQVVAASQAPLEAPAPIPTAPLFLETFAGPALDAAWNIDTAVPELGALDGNGAWFSIVAQGTRYDTAEAANRLILNEPLPEGDFDLVLKTRVGAQTGHDGVFLSVFDSPQSQVTVGFYTSTTGCGVNANLYLAHIRSETDRTDFDMNLFSDDLFVDGVCSSNPAGRAYGNAILQTIQDRGAELRLTRRGRELSGVLTVEMAATDDRAATTLQARTQPVSVLRLTGVPSLIGVKFRDAGDGEAHVWFDEFSIERP